MSRWADYRGRIHRRMAHGPAGPSASEARIRIDKSASLDEQARQIRALFQELGPGYACLALYLSSRVDLLPAQFCREFALVPDSGPVPSASQVQQILEEEFSSGLKSAFLEFETTPIHSGLLAHSHAARLTNGKAVIVKILREECSALANGAAAAHFDQAVIEECCGNSVNENVVRDFLICLQRKCNVPAQMEALDQMAHDSAGCEILRSSKVYHELSTGRIITLEQIEGMPLVEAARSRGCNTEVVARSICHAWLYQALRGSSFPVDPQAHNITLVNNGILFSGCDFAGLPSATKENLWNYVMATMVDDPDKAAMCLLREMRLSSRSRLDSETFRSKFRQSAYFAVLEPLLGTNSNALAQLIFQHWKTAQEYGYTPDPPLLSFYRGLFSVARTAQKLAPFADPLRAGVEEVRSDRIMGQMKEIVDWRYWFQNSDKFAAAMVNLPRIVDDALTRASRPGTETSRWEDSVRPRAGRGASSRGMLALLLLVAAVVLPQAAHANGSSEKIALIALMLAGWILLRDFGQ